MIKRILLLSVATIWMGRAAAPDTNRLNILFCFADDWGRYTPSRRRVEPRSVQKVNACQSKLALSWLLKPVIES